MLLDVATRAAGPQGHLPLTPELLLHAPSGDVFGWTQNAGMGWNPSELNRREFLILSTQGGIRAADGSPVALGYHTGHWEVGLLMQAAAQELRAAGAIPFAGFCTDPCDGRTQGTPGMFDSLPYRNDAASVFRRLIRSLPTRSGNQRQRSPRRRAPRWNSSSRGSPVTTAAQRCSPHPPRSPRADRPPPRRRR